MTPITTNFTLEELTATSTGLPNIPPPNSAALACVKAMARILQECRDILTKPIVVNSCYRSPRVNARVGGSRSSYHLTGCAVDIATYQYTSYDKVTLENALRKYKPVEFIKYDTFWHVAFDIAKLGNHGPVTTYQMEYPGLTPDSPHAPDL